MLEKNFSGKKSVEWRKKCAVVIGEEVSIETCIKWRSLSLQLLYVNYNTPWEFEMIENNNKCCRKYGSTVYVSETNLNRITTVNNISEYLTNSSARFYSSV